MSETLETTAVILAGGAGTRLRPFTFVLPKPLMPVDDLPVIDILLRRLRRSGIRKAIITLGHLGVLVRAVCGDGSAWDMEISYSDESQPLGTIGPLHLIKDRLTRTFVVTNGDVITDLDLGALVEHHRSHGGLVTVACYRKRVKIDLGVMDRDDHGLIAAFREKPEQAFWVSMGTYVFEPGILEFVPEGRPFGFDDLMHTLLSRGVPINTFAHEGYWLDIGRVEDYQRAQEEFRSRRSGILGETSSPPAAD